MREGVHEEMHVVVGDEVLGTLHDEQYSQYLCDELA